jgi:hypothetical protein
MSKSGKTITYLQVPYGDSASDRASLARVLRDCTAPKADSIYLISRWWIDREARVLFGSLYYNTLTDLLGTTIVHGLKEMIPKSWRVVKFMNYKTPRLIEFENYPNYFLNADNRFVDLLLKTSSRMTPSQKLAIEAFFRTLRYGIRSNFDGVIGKQKEILKTFLSSGLLNPDQVGQYVLTRDDFSPHLLKE